MLPAALGAGMETPEELKVRAERYRRLALSFIDEQIRVAISALAAELDELAAKTEIGPSVEPSG
jgi:hypothetical protein